MLFISSEQFLVQANALKKLTRQQEKAAYVQMRAGNKDAKESLVESYLPVVAAMAKRVSTGEPSMELVCRMVATLEREVEQFDFSQESEPFTHRLSLVLKKVVAEYITDQ
ncbi:MAG: hypothetical protein IJW70_07560 [Clostridia bacterium]|nr:hypothetical protein [Clostridia bacterium]